MSELESLDIPRRSRKSLIFVLLGVLVFVVVLGSMGIVAGTGWFGYRSFLYGQSELYALNMGDEALWISVDGRERVEVPARNAQIAEIIGGESEIIVTNEAGEVKGRYTVFVDNSHAFIKLTDEQCLAAINLDPFYKGGATQDIEILASLNEATRVWVPESKNVVWPRKPFPKRFAAGEGRGVWVELVGCPLLEDAKFLDAYLAVRLEERVKKAMAKDKK